MAPHLVGAKITYKRLKDMLISSHIHIHRHTHSCTCTRARTHAHMHTHTLQIHALLVMGWWNEKENDRSEYRREEVGFQF